MCWPKIRSQAPSQIAFAALLFISEIHTNLTAFRAAAAKFLPPGALKMRILGSRCFRYSNQRAFCTMIPLARLQTPEGPKSTAPEPAFPNLLNHRLNDRIKPLHPS